MKWTIAALAAAWFAPVQLHGQLVSVVVQGIYEEIVVQDDGGPGADAIPLATLFPDLLTGSLWGDILNFPGLVNPPTRTPPTDPPARDPPEEIDCDDALEKLAELTEALERERAFLEDLQEAPFIIVVAPGDDDDDVGGGILRKDEYSSRVMVGLQRVQVVQTARQVRDAAIQMARSCREF